MTSEILEVMLNAITSAVNDNKQVDMELLNYDSNTLGNLSKTNKNTFSVTIHSSVERFKPGISLTSTEPEDEEDEEEAMNE